MYKPAARCPQISCISRWGCAPQNPRESDEDYAARITKACRAAARRLKRGYLDWPNDFSVLIKKAGQRLVVLQKVVCCYKEEQEICQAALAEFHLDWTLKIRPRTTFGEEFEYMQHLIENPGWIVIADNGLNQFCWHDDVPGQPDPTPQMVTARIAFALRCAEAQRVTVMGIRHQKSDGAGVTVLGMPPIPQSANTGYVNFNPPKGMGDIQQLFFISSRSKGRWRPWNFLEDKAFALDEHHRAGGKVALYEGLTVRFGEKQLMAERFDDPEHNRNQKSLKKDYPWLVFKKRGAKHHG